MRVPRASQPSLGPALGAAGIVGILIATGLPWISSGQVDRNLYQLEPLAHRLGLADGIPLGVLAAVPLVAAAPIVLFAFRRVRTATGIAVIVAVAATGGGAWCLAMRDRLTGAITVAAFGPIVAVTSGVFVLMGALLTVRSKARKTEGQGR